MACRRIEIVIVSLLVCLLGIAHAHAASARGEMKKGLKLMEQGEFLTASTNFQAAAKLAAGQDRSPARACFNAGNAFYRAEDFAKARASYMRAVNSEELELQSKAFYNTGNIDLEMADSALKEGKAKETIRLYESAISQYEKAIKLSPDYMPPKMNYEIAKKRKYELLRKVDIAREDIGKAKKMIEQYEYIKAARFMQDRKPKNELAFQLNPELKQDYKNLLKRTGQIAKIIVGSE